MKPIFSLILLVLLQLPVHGQITLSPEFLHGEWWSDSIKCEEPGREREFLFFDTQGHFFRTTWQSENYVLDRKLLLSKNLLQRADGSSLLLSVLDSNHVVLEAQNYYGRFERDPYPNISSWKEGLNEFIVGDSIKKLMLGSWSLHSIGLIAKDPADKEDENLKAYERQRDFLDLTLSESMTIALSRDNLLTLQNNDTTARFNYNIDDVALFIGAGHDYMEFKYDLVKGQLWLTEKDAFFDRKLIFKRGPE